VTAKYYRVFGTADAHPDPGAVENALRASGIDAAGEFRGDEDGWFHALIQGSGLACEVNCWLSTEEDIRRELNTWAAWVESTGDGPQQARLMGLIVTARRLYTASGDEALCLALARSLAEATAGVYQIDGAGFFERDGTLLLAEEEED
jgi:hypothetical protein